MSEKSKTPKVPEKEDYEDDYLDEDFEKADLQPELFAPTQTKTVPDKAKSYLPVQLEKSVPTKAQIF